jgi:hypothetical protein
MPLFGWFDTREADVFAKAIADDLMGRVPVSAVGATKSLTPERMHNAHQAIIARAGAFARDHKLNWYRKAHLGNTFRWTLVEQGYDKEFVETWTHNLLVAVSVSRGAAK